MKPAELITNPLSLLTALGLAVMVSACGGSSSGSSSTKDSNGIETGVFLDSPVINLGYRTETQSDSTNSLGEYNYIPGETVTFFIGDLEFPETEATIQVTPLNLANTDDTRDTVVVNIIRLFQTLDKDGDPENGIEITQEAINAATSEIDFNLDESEFETSSAVESLIFNAGQDSSVLSLVDTEDAIQHFEQSLDENMAIDMTTKSASSVITFSACPSDPLGWEYTFTNQSMTLTGSDTWNTSGCTTGQEETFTLNMVGLESDFDVPFNCAEYPVCRSEDFNKTITGTDGDSREFTSTYSFDREESVLTYEKSVAGTTYTEVISIQ